MNTTRYFMLLGATLLSILSAGDAFAENDLTVDIRIQTAYNEDRSYDAFSDGDTLSTFHLAVGHELAAIPGLRTSIAYQVRMPDHDGSRFSGDLELDWQQYHFLGLVDWGPTLWEIFRPYARLGGGYALNTLTATTPERHFNDKTHDIAYTGSVGFEALLGGKKLGDSLGISFAILGQFGYQGQTGADFGELSRDEDTLGEDDPWSRADLSVGTLNTSGLFWDLGLGIRFDF